MRHPEDEASWLRPRIIRLRTALRFVKDSRTETILREFVAEAEERLDALEAGEPTKPAVKPRKTPS